MFSYSFLVFGYARTFIVRAFLLTSLHQYSLIFSWIGYALCCEMWGIFCLRCTKLTYN